MTSPDWKVAYAEIRPMYEIYKEKLQTLVQTVLEHAEIDIVVVDGRVKTLDSFAEKISRKSDKYANPIKDMTDLVGLRIIAYYVEDVDEIVRVLRDEFEVLEEHSSNKQDDLALDQFGYASNHLIARIGGRGSFAEWRDFSNVAVEFQVRTTLQHAWASVSHKLSYKRVEEVPTSLQRRLFRLSALFEMADEQFSAIRNAASELSDEYIDSVRRGNLAIKIDADSIDAYIQGSRRASRILKIAADEFHLKIASSANEIERSRSDLIRVASHLEAKTIEEFENLLPDENVTREALRAYQTESTRIDTITRGDGTAHEVFVLLLLIVHDIAIDIIDSIYADGKMFKEAQVKLRSQT